MKKYKECKYANLTRNTEGGEGARKPVRWGGGGGVLHNIFSQSHFIYIFVMVFVCICVAQPQLICISDIYFCQHKNTNTTYKYKRHSREIWWGGGGLLHNLIQLLTLICIVFNVFRSCYLNKLFCIFLIFFSIDLLVPGQHFYLDCLFINIFVMLFVFAYICICISACICICVYLYLHFCLYLYLLVFVFAFLFVFVFAFCLYLLAFVFACICILHFCLYLYLPVWCRVRVLHNLPSFSATRSSTAIIYRVIFKHYFFKIANNLNFKLQKSCTTCPNWGEGVIWATP